MSLRGADHIVNMVATVYDAAKVLEAEGVRYPDSNTSEGFGQVLEGLVLLLNEDMAGYDQAAVYQVISDTADRVSWSLDDSEVIY